MCPRMVSFFLCILRRPHLADDVEVSGRQDPGDLLLGDLEPLGHLVGLATRLSLPGTDDDVSVAVLEAGVGSAHDLPGTLVVRLPDDQFYGQMVYVVLVP